MAKLRVKPKEIQTIYLALMLLSTLAASLIWGINTLFLLDAGLTNVEAFAANAFFTIGQVIFEVPTGVVADSLGRRVSYLLGTLTLSLSTLLYLLAWQVHAPFWAWAITSVLLGLGFTFFSGATEAWLVDALNFAGFKGKLEQVFAKGQIAGGVAMLLGSVGGGVIAQFSNLGVPYIVRAIILAFTFGIAFIYMKDIGFTPKRSSSVVNDMQEIVTKAMKHGFKKPAIKWIMLAAPFGAGVSFYAFYAMQPHLLVLYGDSTAYGIAGLAAAIVACAQIIGGLTVVHLKRVFQLRTTIMLTGVVCSAGLLGLIGISASFYAAVFFLIIWGLTFAAVQPVRQAYLNGLIDSKQRATVLSFDSLMASSGGVVIQPVLGKVADVWSYGASYLIGALIQLLALPLILLAKKEHPISDALND